MILLVIYINFVKNYYAITVTYIDFFKITINLIITDISLKKF